MEDMIDRAVSRPSRGGLRQMAQPTLRPGPTHPPSFGGLCPPQAGGWGCLSGSRNVGTSNGRCI